MVGYGKTASNAIGTLSYLAEIYGEEKNSAGSPEIAKIRDISKSLAAKLLTVLSTSGYVRGVPGPKGGYTLAREPKDITLFEIVILFEKMSDALNCPFGPNWCGNKEPCPLHDKLADARNRMETFLKETTLEVFVKNEQKCPV
jgi:Rrf2 family transcriptional regulator, iron-sulfur cluster assembly transcription factor